VAVAKAFEKFNEKGTSRRKRDTKRKTGKQMERGENEHNKVFQ
jgi:hypothetical protein